MPTLSERIALAHKIKKQMDDLFGGQIKTGNRLEDTQKPEYAKLKERIPQDYQDASLISYYETPESGFYRQGLIGLRRYKEIGMGLTCSELTSLVLQVMIENNMDDTFSWMSMREYNGSNQHVHSFAIIGLPQGIRDDKKYPTMTKILEVGQEAVIIDLWNSKNPIVKFSEVKEHMSRLIYEQQLSQDNQFVYGVKCHIPDVKTFMSNMGDQQPRMLEIHRQIKMIQQPIKNYRDSIILPIGHYTIVSNEQANTVSNDFRTIALGIENCVALLLAHKKGWAMAHFDTPFGIHEVITDMITSLRKMDKDSPIRVELIGGDRNYFVTPLPILALDRSSITIYDAIEKSLQEHDLDYKQYHYNTVTYDIKLITAALCVLWRLLVNQWNVAVITLLAVAGLWLSKKLEDTHHRTIHFQGMRNEKLAVLIDPRDLDTRKRLDDSHFQSEMRHLTSAVSNQVGRENLVRYIDNRNAVHPLDLFQKEKLKYVRREIKTDYPAERGEASQRTVYR